MRFVSKQAYCDRVYHITPDDLLVVLSRIPEQYWSRVRTIHFNDRAKGNRILGYVGARRDEITMCALPPRVSFSPFLVAGQTCAEFGAVYGTQWPITAVRRFLLYDVFLHEIGHCQQASPAESEDWEGFAGEKYAQRFADHWRRKLWQTCFVHHDPVHNSPLLFQPQP
ncbi:MAG: hypothetical protein K1Y36_16715 [Blastocatellia bacterium]|nr:hypothetical protein [Blastocatellia bacterium]